MNFCLGYNLIKHIKSVNYQNVKVNLCILRVARCTNLIHVVPETFTKSEIVRKSVVRKLIAHLPKGSILKLGANMVSFYSRPLFRREDIVSSLKVYPCLLETIKTLRALVVRLSLSAG